MKFQKYRKRNTHKPYQYYYLDYEVLRDHISNIKSPEEESTFVKLLDENFLRVFGFVDAKQSELNRRVDFLYKQTCTSKLNLKVNHLSDEMKNFSEFIRINVVGFRKLLKRHDNKTN